MVADTLNQVAQSVAYQDLIAVMQGIMLIAGAVLHFFRRK